MPKSSNRGPQAESVLLAMIAGTSLAAALLVAFDSIGTEGRRSSQQFQALTGGLGMGSHTDLSRCPWLFDARLTADHHPALGYTSNDPDACMWHAMSIFPTPESVDSGERDVDSVWQDGNSPHGS